MNPFARLRKKDSRKGQFPGPPGGMEPRLPGPSRILLLFIAALVVVGIGLLVAQRNRIARQTAAPEEPLAPDAVRAVVPGERDPEEEAREREQDQARLLGLFEGALLDAQNGTDFAQTEGYLKLLELVKQTPPERFGALVTGDLDWNAAVRTPDHVRGTYVRVRGLVGDLWAVKLRRSVLETGDVYRGVLVQAWDVDGEPTDDGEGVIFDLVEEPIQFALRQDVVEVDGVLYRTVRYQSHDGEAREAPYLVARTLRVLEPERRSPTIFPWVIGGLILAYVIGRGVVYWIGKRRRRRPTGSGSLRSMFEARIHGSGDRAGPSDPDPNRR